MKNLSPKQILKIKGPIVDANNKLNSIFKSFDPFNHEFSPSNRLVDSFSSCFSFFLLDRKGVDSRKTHLHKLNKVIFNALADSKTAVIISDASIKNNIATSISHIHTHTSPVLKTIHHAINVTSTEAELFTIRCRLNQAILLSNIKCIVVITNSIYTAKKSLICLSILIKSKQLPFPRKLGSFSKEIITILLNSGIVQVKTNGCFTIWLIKRPRISTYPLYLLACYD